MGVPRQAAVATGLAVWMGPWVREHAYVHSLRGILCDDLGAPSRVLGCNFSREEREKYETSGELFYPIRCQMCTENFTLEFKL